MKWKFEDSELPEIKFDLRGDWYLRESKKIKNAYYCGFGNVSFILDRESLKL